jgi:hypothetical protein
MLGLLATTNCPSPFSITCKVKEQNLNISGSFLEYLEKRQELAQGKKHLLLH